MSVAELLPMLRERKRADKLRVLQFLVLELAKEEDRLLTPGVDYQAWSPHNAFDAANTLLDVLKADATSYA